jgi:aspartate/methionine/tyrosine aminotransferase
MRLCQKYSIHLLSDEVYALFVWANSQAPQAPHFTSMLSHNPDGLIDPSLVHILWGMSKVRGSISEL